MHPFGDLSAYLDDALSPEARTSVQAHLDTCALCRTRLAELRGTARLIAALPMPVPSRSLVPRVSVPVWLAPLRTFSTFASGAAIFLFLAASLIAFFPRGQSAATAGAAPNTVSAPQVPAGGAGAAASSSSDFNVSPSFNASSPNPAKAVTSDSTASRAPATPADSSKEVGRQDSGIPPSDAARLESSRLTGNGEPAPFAFLLSPWLWLALAIAFAAVSFAVGRRLRSI